MLVEHFIGVGFLFLGLLSLSSYTDRIAGVKINWFYKELKPMQERWGKTPGTVLHIVEYVVAPLGFGMMFLMGLVVFR